MTRERGAVLLALVVIVVAVSTVAFVTTARTSAKSQAALAERRALSIAREALLGAAQRRYCLNPAAPIDALLPCPDGPAAEGEAAVACPGTSRGWLPWRSLGLPPLRDASGTCLWIERSTAAVRIIAPGGARPGQSRISDPTRRVCGGNLDAANYVDPDDVSLTLTLAPALLSGVCP